MEPDLTPAACDRTVRGRYGDHQWPCMRALGHDGDCLPPIEARHYTGPLSQQTPEWLAAEVRMLLGQVERMQRDHRQDRTPAVHHRLVARLIGIAPANGSRKTVPAEAVRRAWQEAIDG